MYALYLAEDGRILHATFKDLVTNVIIEGHADPNGEPIMIDLLFGYVLVDDIPDGDLTDYRYADGAFIYDPMPAAEAVPTQLDAIEAQVVYTAMMTDTLLEV